MKRFLGKAVSSLDRVIARQWIRHGPDSNELLIICLHAVVESERDLGRNILFPLLTVTRDDLRQMIDYFLESAYTFIAPQAVLGPLPPGKYALLTFDDGYANNRLIVPLLREYRVPAVIYLSAGHMETGRGFWWDILYRERKKRGAPDGVMAAERRELKGGTAAEIERHLVRQFGSECLLPAGDLDRPFSPSEVRTLSDETLIHWGNHTLDHAILPNYPADGMRAQIADAGRMIFDMTGLMPDSIAYPDGAVSADVIAEAAGAGLRIGMTTARHRNRLPVNEEGLMRLGRFPLKHGEDIRSQCERMRSGLNISAALYNFRERLRGSGYRR